MKYEVQSIKSAHGALELELITAYRIKKQPPQLDDVNVPGNNVQNGTAPSNNITPDSAHVKSVFDLFQHGKATVFDIILDSDSVRHAFDKPEHNLKDDDLDDMAEIINTTNNIYLSNKKYNGKPVIEFQEEKENGVILIEEFRSGKHGDRTGGAEMENQVRKINYNAVAHIVCSYYCDIAACDVQVDINRLFNVPPDLCIEHMQEDIIDLASVLSEIKNGAFIAAALDESAKSALRGAEGIATKNKYLPENNKCEIKKLIEEINVCLNFPEQVSSAVCQ